MDGRVEFKQMRASSEAWRHQLVITIPALGAGLIRRHWTPEGKIVKTKNGDRYQVMGASLHAVSDAEDIQNVPLWAPTLYQQGFDRYISYELQRINKDQVLVGEKKEIRVYFKSSRKKKKD